MFCAGIIHLILPDKFLPAIPPFIPQPYYVIYFTGFLEIILGGLLLKNNFRDLAAKILAIYFLLLLPVHIYVINGNFRRLAAHPV